MKKKTAIWKMGEQVLVFLSTALAMALIIYSGYVLWDSFYTGKAAFSSWDLMQYKPTITKDGVPSFVEIKEINTDVVAWLTVNNTNIDYPVVQGVDDLEYSNKDIYGNPSLTGTIYLTYANNRDFKDSYSLIYGHHMDNGAMFGDISKFKDRDYFDSHREAILITDNQVYNLHIFSLMQTNAYDTMIYSVSEKDSSYLPKLLKYVESKALIYDAPDEMPAKVVALSTCADETTYGRHVLFAEMTPRTEPLPEKETVTITDVMPPMGHNGADSWALLNLICMILTIYTTIPIFGFCAKFLRRKPIKKANESCDKLMDSLFGDDETEENQKEENREKEKNGEEQKEKNEEEKEEEKRTPLYSIGQFRSYFWPGFFAQVLLSVGAFVLFWLTENIRLPMTIIDEWTPHMIMLFNVVWMTDVLMERFYCWTNGEVYEGMLNLLLIEAEKETKEEFPPELIYFCDAEQEEDKEKAPESS